jgi:kinesin family protein 18/19
VFRYLHSLVQRRQRGIPNHHAQHKDSLFAFDRVFGESASSNEVFMHTTKDLVTEVLSGFNCTCFAYGPTGSGKTFTMIGNSSAPGVMVQTMHELFSRMKEEDDRIYDVKISYLEVYNETIRDLLVASKFIFSQVTVRFKEP